MGVQLSVAVLLAVQAGGALSPAGQADGEGFTAKWIWQARGDYGQYNDTIVARKRFVLPEIDAAKVRITADTRYRLFVNGEWVNDGPCRSWPSHFQYDVIDVEPYLRTGENELQVVAKFAGTGTFIYVPQQAGLLVQLDAVGKDGARITVGSDETWEVAEASAWFRETLKRCVQMGPYEVYDARREGYEFQPATVLFAAGEGPWKDLNPRDCPLLTKDPETFARFVGASRVAKDWLAFGFPTGRLLYPDRFDTNHHVSTMSAVVTRIDCEADMTLHVETFDSANYRYFANGVEVKDGACPLRKGSNLFGAVIGRPFVHWQRDTAIRFAETEGFALRNPLDESAADPWCFVPMEEALYAIADYQWELLPREEQQAITRRISKAAEEVIGTLSDADTFRAANGNRAITLREDQIMDDPHFQFARRRVLGAAEERVENAGGLIHGLGDATVVRPTEDGDVELVYDLGCQRVGYWRFEVKAEAGLIVDVAGVEYIAPSGEVQHTGAYRNSLRYICKEGWNRFTSFERRSGRYLFITLRNQTKPALLRRFEVVESTYPVEQRGSFACSDEALTRIWSISARTLALCMEDTFTDCPLYEQTHWVGDARNESLFAYTAYGAYDLARRCIRLTGLSLEKYPIVLSQTPSTWEVLIPAFSCLWTMSVWDYYFHTGDRELLKEAYPWLIRNLQGAETFVNDRGLFSAPMWNFFDWTKIDQYQRTVLHNSMLLVGAIDAARKCGEALGDDTHAAWLADYRERVVRGVNALWNEEKGAYPDSIRDSGEVSPSISMHTSFLAILHDIVEERNREQAVRNILNPPEDMVRVGSPFALFYAMQALEKSGHADEIVKMIRQNYAPMLEMGATTVWESFATGTTGRDGFPTRSHSHAWSSAPVYYLNRLVLGIVPEAPGGREYVVSPRLSGLTWARGTSASIRGNIEVSWRVEGDTLEIFAQGPRDVSLRFVRNDSHEGLKVLFNGTPQE
jgi:alpha-L-rhamnosidase